MKTEIYQNSSCASTGANGLTEITKAASTAVDGRTTVADAQRAAEKAQKEAAPIVVISDTRVRELIGIAKMFPGGHRHVERVEEALRRGPLNSVEAIFLGSLHVPARIHQLAERYDLFERWVRTLGWDGELHRVKEWSLAPQQSRSEVQA